MIEVESYLQKLIQLLKNQFGTSLLYVGLQGSYLRGEATENSDLDIMVILDTLHVSDLKLYWEIIRSMNDSDKSCGFICSKSDLANWNPFEIWSLINGTKDYYGKLIDFVPSYSKTDICNFVKISLNNLYHEICHRYIHAECNTDINALAGAYKSVFFILQNLYYLKYGKSIKTKAEMLAVTDGKDHMVMQRAIALQQDKSYDFTESFELLHTWCHETLLSLRDISENL